MKSKRTHKKSHKNRTRRHKKMHKKSTRRHNRKQSQGLTLPGSQGLPLFSVPDKKQSYQIHVNQSNSQSGNMIKGLRHM